MLLLDRHMTPQLDSQFASLTPDQVKIVLALAQGTTFTAAAQAAGLNRVTIYRWLKTQEAFAAAVEQARADYILTLRDQLKDYTVHALATLGTLLDDPNTPPAVRFRIAMVILNRPQFPKPGWNLPEPVLEPNEEEFLRSFACLEADYKGMRYQDALNAKDRENETK